ncbi:MAG: glycosyltransferase [Bacteroidales bacterium]|nr:glycosyltransferase [Bacteroidales bacterium]
MVKISIITAVYNNREHLKDCIRSVINQSYPHIEYIIIDGGSTDGTLDVIKEFGPQISRWISEPDRGIYDALNKGISICTGDVVGILHSDDLFGSDDTLAHIARTFEKYSCDAVYGNLVYTPRHETNKVLRFWKSNTFDKGLLSRGWMPPHPTLFIKNEWFKEKGSYRTDFKIAADYDLILRFFGTARFKSVYIDEVVTRMRTGGASNKSFRNIYLKSKEDWIALRENRIGGLVTLFRKNFQKLTQFIKKPEPETKSESNPDIL